MIAAEHARPATRGRGLRRRHRRSWPLSSRGSDGSRVGSRAAGTGSGLRPPRAGRRAPGWPAPTAQERVGTRAAPRPWPRRARRACVACPRWRRGHARRCPRRRARARTDPLGLRHLGLGDAGEGGCFGLAPVTTQGEQQPGHLIRPAPRVGTAPSRQLDQVAGRRCSSGCRAHQVLNGSATTHARSRSRVKSCSRSAGSEAYWATTGVLTGHRR